MADSPTKAKAEAFPPYDDCLEHSSSSSSDDGELSFADELQEPSILDDIFSDDDDEVEEHEEENQEEEEEKEPKEDVEGQHQKKKLGMSSNEVQQKELNNNNNKQEVCGKPTQKLFGACIDGDNAKIKRVCSHSDSESDSSSDSNAVDRSDNRSEPDKAASGKAEVPEHKVQENTSHPQAVGPCGKADASEVEPRGKHDDHNNNNNNNNNNNDINAGQMPPKEHEQENEVEWHGQGQDTAMQAPDSTSRALEVSPKHVVHLREAEHFPGPQEQFPQQKEEKKAPQKGHEHEQKKRELPDTQVNTEATSQFGLLGRIPVDLSESDTDLDLEVPAGTTPAPSLALAEATVCNHKSPTGLDEPSPVTPPQQATVPLGQEARLLRRSHGEAAAAGGTYPDDTACSQHPIQQQALLDTENGSRSRSRSRSRNPRTRRGNQGAHKSTSSASGIRSNSSKSSKSSKSRSSTSSSSTCSKASSPSSTTASKPRRHRRRHRHRRQHRCHRDSALGQHDSKGSHEQGQEHELEHEHELKRGEHHHHHHQHELDEAPDGYAATAAAAAAPRGLKRRREKRRRGGQRIRKLREEMQRRHQEKQARKSSQTGQGSHSPNEVYVTGFGPHLDKAGVAQLFESLFEQLWEYREHFGVGNSNEGKRGRGRSGVAGANKKEKQMKNKKNMTAAVKSVNLDPSRGFTFMEFEDEVLRQTACALSGYRLPHGRKLIVRPAQGVSAEVPLSLNVSPLISPEERDVGTGGKRASSLFSQVWIGKLPQVYRENHGFLREDVERILRADPAVRARYGNKNLILSVRFGVDDYFAYLHLLDEALAAAMVALGELKTQSGDVMWLRWPNGNREGERSRHPPRATFVLTQPQPDPPKCEEDTRNVFHSGDKYDLCSDYFRHSSNSCDPSNVNVPKWSSNSCATASNRGSCRGSTSSNTVGAAVFSSGSGGISINNSSRRRSDEGCLSADHQQQERQQQQQHHHHHQQQQQHQDEPQHRRYQDEDRGTVHLRSRDEVEEEDPEKIDRSVKLSNIQGLDPATLRVAFFKLFRSVPAYRVQYKQVSEPVQQLILGKNTFGVAVMWDATLASTAITLGKMWVGKRTVKFTRPNNYDTHRNGIETAEPLQLTKSLKTMQTKKRSILAPPPKPTVRIDSIDLWFGPLGHLPESVDPHDALDEHLTKLAVQSASYPEELGPPHSDIRIHESRQYAYVRLRDRRWLPELLEAYDGSSFFKKRLHCQVRRQPFMGQSAGAGVPKVFDSGAAEIFDDV